MFNEDLTYASKPLQSQMITLSLQEQKNYYDMLHFSPLKVCNCKVFEFHNQHITTYHKYYIVYKLNFKSYSFKFRYTLHFH